MEIKIFSDPKYSWARVKRGLIYISGIENEISENSYKKNDVVYLKSGSDLRILLSKLSEEDYYFKFNEGAPSPVPHVIRKYETFNSKHWN